MRTYNTAQVKIKEESFLKGDAYVLREAEKEFKNGKSRSLDKNISICKDRRAEIRDHTNTLSWHKITAWESK